MIYYLSGLERPVSLEMFRKSGGAYLMLSHANIARQGTFLPLFLELKGSPELIPDDGRSPEPEDVEE